MPTTTAPLGIGGAPEEEAGTEAEEEATAVAPEEDEDIVMGEARWV